MTLWTKRLTDLTYQDVDDFCQSGIPEGTQVDYKVGLPKDIDKLVAAFANTRGGLVLLGVHADQTTNIPSGASPGMAVTKGLSEQITQICRDRIYPPIIPECSPIIAHPDDAEKIFLVIRVDESKLAPHSVRNGTHVYVRTKDVNHAIELAHVDRIASLLQRRGDSEQRREAILSRYLRLLDNRFGGAPRMPCFWYFLAPEFAEEEVCALDASRHGVFEIGCSRAPGGYIGFGKGYGSDDQDRKMSACSRQGDLFYARKYQHSPDRPLYGRAVAVRLLQFMRHCRDFYHRDDVRHPGLLRLTVGASYVAGVRLASSEIHDAMAFPDDSYRTDATCSVDEISDEISMFDLVRRVTKELFHAFDIDPPPPLSGYWQ